MNENVKLGLMRRVRVLAPGKNCLRSQKVKRPDGMSGRQWKRARKAARRA